MIAGSASTSPGTDTLTGSNGYQEPMGLHRRSRLLDSQRLLEALGGVTVKGFRRQYEALILERIAKDELKRGPGWTEAIAVGTGEVAVLATVQTALMPLLPIGTTLDPVVHGTCTVGRALLPAGR